jgi:RNA polymerase primary sigma factor
MVIDREYRSADALQLYMREMAETPLLTPQEEIELSRRVKKGDSKARARMIKANLRLVVKISRDYSNFGLPLLDLINEGNLGLMKAVDRFDPKKGAKLSTYAALWIKQSIRRALSNQSRTIRLPVHMADQLHKLNRVSLKLTEALGREPNNDELGQDLNISPAKVAQLRALGIRPTSLDAPIGEEADGRYGDIIEDEGAATPFELLRTKAMRQEIQQHVKELPAREAEILVLRYGLDGREPRTLEEVGKQFKVTRERIRQIQEIALNKLRRRIESLEVGQS